MARILVADDEEGVRSFLAEALERDGHDVVTARDGREAIEVLREGGFDLV
jgi:two-component system response regulator FlrC